MDARKKKPKREEKPKPPPKGDLAEWCAKFERVWGRKPSEKDIKYR